MTGHAPLVPPAKPPDLSTWLSTHQVAGILGCSESNVKLLAAQKKLRAQIDERGWHRFSPAEVHAFANGRREKRKAKQQSVSGQIAARVFRLLDRFERDDKLDVAKREIVRRVKIDPTDAQRLFEQWLLPFDEALRIQREAEAQAKQERAEERAAERDATLERERLRAQRAGARADEAMLEAVQRGGRRRKDGGEP